MDLLLDAGYEWFGNGLADDAPHWWVTDFASRRARNPTGSALAAHWSSHHPLGELKPSIWQDHPGSLS
jgi:hypothetical protein